MLPLTALMVFWTIALVMFGCGDGREREAPMSGAEVRVARRHGGWLGLLVPLGLACLAALVSLLDPWFHAEVRDG